MTRIPVSPERIFPKLSLLATERHYLIDVLRLNDGAEIEVFDGLGNSYHATLDTAHATLTLGNRITSLESETRLCLAPALIKNDRLDWVIEKATELGVERIEPFCCTNCVVRLDEHKSALRRSRWQKIAASAARQCGRSVIPEILMPEKLAAVLRKAHERDVHALLLFEREVTCTLSEAIRGSDPNRPLLLITGPEGGFRDDEIEEARRLGARTASLGKRILRADTAPIAALAVAQALLGQM